MNKHKNILEQLPYTQPFLFVDGLEQVDEKGAEGHYTFPENAFYYQGHFKDYPVTPGVILTEVMAQIGVVCLGIFLLGLDKKIMTDDNIKIAMTSSNMDFLSPVFPKEKITVQSEKIYFRFGKLKCLVRAFNQSDELVAKGEISGILKIQS